MCSSSICAWLGSSAMNCVAAVRTARRLGPGHTVVTVLCDGGQRYLGSVHKAQPDGAQRPVRYLHQSERSHAVAEHGLRPRP